MTNLIPPVLKWPGSKRAMAERLSQMAPNSERLIDPFVGGGSMLAAVQRPAAVAGDVIPELIQLWEEIRNRPDQLATAYQQRWERLQQQGHTAYYEIRESFNRTRNPADFLFLTRTCVNGLVRFNTKGDFNNSLHHTRPGVHPARLRATILMWSQLVARTSFVCADYRETLARAQREDFVFLDPPYGGTRGRYLAVGIDQQDFYEELERLNRRGIRWMLTFDGEAGDRVYCSAPPADLYRHRFEIANGNSPFTRLMKTSLDAVRETVYLNYDVPGEVVGQQWQDVADQRARRPRHNVDNNALYIWEELAADREIEGAVVQKVR